MATSPPTTLLESVFTHLCLIEPLPSRPEDNGSQIDDELGHRLSQALQQLRILTSASADGPLWEGVQRDLDRVRELHRDSILDRKKLRIVAAQLQHEDFLVLHVARQNAAICIHRTIKNRQDVVIFEAFEVAARSEQTLASTGSLQRHFPGTCAQLPFETFISKKFLDEMCSFLEQASTQAVSQLMPKAGKAGAETVEIRDTCDPALITDVFMGIIETLGCRTSTPQLQKSVWDCVQWDDGARVPWRRSSFWLTLRVGLQKGFYKSCGPHAGYIRYKFLMCTLFAQLLDDARDKLHPTLVQALIGKLGKRLSKIEKVRVTLPEDALVLYRSLAESLEPFVNGIIASAKSQVLEQYRATQAQSVRRIRSVPGRPPPFDCELELNNSFGYLHHVLSQPQAYSGVPRMASDLSTARDKDYTQFSATYRGLARTEDQLRSLSQADTSGQDLPAVCENIAAQILTYLTTIGSRYNADSLQLSYMLLTLMELWVAMDKIVTKLFPVLLDFAPGFPTEIMNKLHLPLRKDLERIRVIELHLQDRNQFCTTPSTVFADPHNGCFAEKWYNHASNFESLESLRQKLAAEDDQLRDKKRVEYDGLMVEYRAAWERWLVAECTQLRTEFIDRHGNLVIDHDRRICPKCRLGPRFMFLSLELHEHMLPRSESDRKALLVERHLPPSFICYRDTTWKILNSLGRPQMDIQGTVEVKSLAWHYGRLSKFPKLRSRGLTLGSITKSFDQTHYRLWKLAVQGLPKFSDVCKPNGMQLRYCSSESKLTINADKLQASFDHLFVMTFPPHSPFASLQYSENLDLNGDGPSSNQIIAAQTKCPSGLSPHEFKAFLALCSGHERRWLEILVAMCSTDLNFSTEAVAHLLTRQVLQIGPRGNGHILRTCHRLFQDRSFCDRLLQQLSVRIVNAAANWRETTTMNLLLTITLRLYSLSTLQDFQDDALKMIHKIRQVTWNWIKMLRDENSKADNASSALTFQQYCRTAALICRRTFAYLLEADLAVDSQSLRCFLETSIALHDNLPSNSRQWPSQLRQRLLEDTKTTERLRQKFRTAIMLDIDAVVDATTSFWPALSHLKTSVASESQFLSQDDAWVKITTNASSSASSQRLDFNWLEGHLFINQCPVGSLPAEYRTHLVLNELFGEQILRTFPSELPGMSYKLAITPEGNTVHLGLRKGQLIIRTWKEGRIMELVDREIFRGDQARPYDLPFSMIDGCTHWLDIRTWCVDIRRNPQYWGHRPGNWKIDVKAKRASRRGGSQLIDPTLMIDRQRFAKSSFDSIARTFQHFEDPAHITAWLPKTRCLHVKLDRLDLTFVVIGSGRLICKELHAVVDDNQDAGTWHGLESMLVMRNLKVLRQRSILVPLGNVTCEPRGMHMKVSIQPNGFYCKYSINKELGRLDSPAEPRALYLKALLHAYTSRAVPDALTRRTGTEEALHCVSSGLCRPYQPLDPACTSLLDQLAALTPIRQWYPEDLRVLEKVTWKQGILAASQDEAFYGIVRSIRHQSDRISRFFPNDNERTIRSMQSGGDLHLRERALHRRRRYCCSGFDPPVAFRTSASCTSSGYSSRDIGSAHPARNTMLEVLELLKQWPTFITNTVNLVGFLTDAPVIHGFQQSFSGSNLHDCLTADPVLELGPLIRLCRDANFDDRLRLIFLFSLVSYQKELKVEFFKLFVSFAIFEDLKTIQLPTPSLFSNFSHSNNPTRESLARIIETCVPEYSEALDENPDALKCLPQRRARAQREMVHKRNVRDSALTIATHVLKHWPGSEIDMTSCPSGMLIDPTEALSKIEPVLESAESNSHLFSFIHEVMSALSKHQASFAQSATLQPIPEITAKPYPVMLLDCNTIELSQLCRKCVQQLNVSSCQTPTIQQSLPYQQTGMPLARPEIKKLEHILRPLASQRSAMRVKYANDLLESVRALSRTQNPNHNPEAMKSRESLELAIQESQSRVREQEVLVTSALQSNDNALSWLGKTGMLPRMTPVTLLEQLQSVKQVQFGSGMKEAFVAYGVAITGLQRLLRIEDALLRQHHERHKAEVSNSGHQNWLCLANPDWLLLEIEANILMRPRQVEVARATITPESASNSLLQLQMGQGKSLCIVPAVAAVLADGKRLVRVIVPRPLLTQTARELQKRLGGLLGRYIIHLPFSRRTSTEQAVIAEYLGLHSETLAAGGIEVVIPEHMMSFKLSGQQRLSDSNIAEAAQMIKAQRWMEDNCRDIMDESDHILSPKVQLIYPGGAQMAVDGSPQRWEIAQVMIYLVAGHLDSLKSSFQRSIEVVKRRDGGLPFVYFLRKDVEEALITLLIKDAERGAISALPLSESTATDRQAVLDFISKPTVRKQVVEKVERLYLDNQAALHVVYFLRGCLVHKLLLLTFKRRFHVHYGMHPTRPGLSVPFQYKGVPSDTAEWGHPDVAILFTCLSFYYEGLSQDQLRQSLQAVAKSDNPTGEYENWTHHAQNMPQSLKDWNGINIDDAAQMVQIHRYIRLSMPAANHFLNVFVFPKYAKQFSTKLHASAWDIPLFSSRSNVSQNTSGHLTTGFSGTADGRYLFPLNVRQRAMRSLAHTDAEVLAFLLQERNRRYVVAKDRTGRRLSEQDFLSTLTYHRIRVLIDAGAQIMEMDNLALIRCWLKLDNQAKAAVYFNSENMLTVMHRNGKRIPFSASPFAEDLTECLVYFAQANCRGSDVPLPLDAHAALTLSLGQTKDATVQAAMRLRQLGTTQRLTWYATPEVDQSIQDHQKAPGMSGYVNSAKVISWLLQQTCEGIEALTPLFYSQGKNYCERVQADMDNGSSLSSSAQKTAYLNVIRQPERQTLKQLYAPRTQKQIEQALTGLGAKLAPFMRELTIRKKNFDDQSGSAVISAALEEVEVEREYAYEVEQIREAQKPVHFKPLEFQGLHQNLKAFIRTGRLPTASTAADLAFDVLKRTGPGRKYGINSAALSSRLFVSTEFTRTVEIPDGQSGDNFMRQPKYLLYSKVSDMAVVVSPEEVELILKRLHTSKDPLAHLMTFAAPVTRRMLIFNDLQYFNFPALPKTWSAPVWLKVELGLFAGRLYFGWDEYDRLVELVGLQSQGKTTTSALAISDKPISLIQDLLDLRRKGQEIYNTPIGYITQGKKLDPNHAFFAAEDDVSRSVASPEQYVGLGTNGISNVDLHGKDGGQEKADDGDLDYDVDEDEDEDGMISEEDGGAHDR